MIIKLKTLTVTQNKSTNSYTCLLAIVSLFDIHIFFVSHSHSLYLILCICLSQRTNYFQCFYWAYLTKDLWIYFFLKVVIQLIVGCVSW